MKFIRFNPNNGMIVSFGDMEETHIDQMVAQGDYLRKTPEMDIKLGEFKLLLPPCGLPPVPEHVIINYGMFPIVDINQFINVPSEEEVKTTIDNQITAILDLYQEREESEWVTFKTSLTDAQQATGLGNTISLLPTNDPDGKDWFRNIWQFTPNTA
jgi:hypothetical protein